jgi:hypothetical protein
LNHNILCGKKWAACGDSFTNGDFKGAPEGEPLFTDGPFAGKRRTYDYLIAERNGMRLQHLAVGGMTLATPEKEEGFTNCFSLDAYRQIDPDVDYITLYFGINDSHHAGVGKDGEVTNGYIPVGTIDDETKDTFYGAWNVVMKYLIEHYPFAHIGIIVSNGCGIPVYPEAEIAIAKKYGVPYINLNGDERTPAMIRAVNPNLDPEIVKVRDKAMRVTEKNRHPNPKAHAYEADFIESWLRGI